MNAVLNRNKNSPQTFVRPSYKPISANKTVLQVFSPRPPVQTTTKSDSSVPPPPSISPKLKNILEELESDKEEGGLHSPREKKVHLSSLGREDGGKKAAAPESLSKLREVLNRIVPKKDEKAQIPKASEIENTSKEKPADSLKPKTTKSEENVSKKQEVPEDVLKKLLEE